MLTLLGVLILGLAAVCILIPLAWKWDYTAQKASVHALFERWSRGEIWFHMTDLQWPDEVNLSEKYLYRAYTRGHISRAHLFHRLGNRITREHHRAA